VEAASCKGNLLIYWAGLEPARTNASFNGTEWKSPVQCSRNWWDGMEAALYAGQLLM
jgi:hypothetical protein